MNKRIKPSYIPKVKSGFDTRHFDCLEEDEEIVFAKKLEGDDDPFDFLM